MDDLDAVAVGICHWNKAPTTAALDRVLGSRAFTAAARAVLGVGIDPADPDGRVVVMVKSNLGRMDTPSLGFNVQSRFIEDPEGGLPIETSGLQWTGERANVHASDLFATGTNDDDVPALERAQAHLRERLDEEDVVPTKELDEWCDAVGISRRTMRRARQLEDVLGEQRRDESGHRISGWSVRRRVPLELGGQGSEVNEALASLNGSHEQG
jgi:hypothetical protein